MVCGRHTTASRAVYIVRIVIGIVTRPHSSFVIVFEQSAECRPLPQPSLIIRLHSLLHPSLPPRLRTYPSTITTAVTARTHTLRTSPNDCLFTAAPAEAVARRPSSRELRVECEMADAEAAATDPDSGDDEDGCVMWPRRRAVNLSEPCVPRTVPPPPPSLSSPITARLQSRLLNGVSALSDTEETAGRPCTASQPASQSTSPSRARHARHCSIAERARGRETICRRTKKERARKNELKPERR